VKRGEGDRLAPDPIVDNLCNAQAPAVNKGKNYLYDAGFEKKFYDISMPFRNVSCGNTIEVQDVTLGQIFRAKVGSVRISAAVSSDSVNIREDIKIERSLTGE